MQYCIRHTEKVLRITNNKITCKASLTHQRKILCCLSGQTEMCQRKSILSDVLGLKYALNIRYIFCIGETVK